MIAIDPIAALIRSARLAGLDLKRGSDIEQREADADSVSKFQRRG